MGTTLTAKMGREKPQTDDPLAEPTLGRRIWSARLARGINRSKFARMLGVSYTTVDQWDLGESTPKRENMERAAEVLGYTIDELTHGRRRRSAAIEDESWETFRATPEYRMCEPWMVEAMRAVAAAVDREGRQMTLTTYRQMAVAFLSIDGDEHR